MIIPARPPSVNTILNGIAFGQSRQAKYIKSKQSFDICYTLEDNAYKHGEVQLQIESMHAKSRSNDVQRNP